VQFGPTFALDYGRRERNFWVQRQGAQNRRENASDWTERNKLAGAKLIEHTLAIADFMVGLEIACRERGDIKLLHEREILANASERTQKPREPLRLANLECLRFHWPPAGLAQDGSRDARQNGFVGRVGHRPEQPPGNPQLTVRGHHPATFWWSMRAYRRAVADLNPAAKRFLQSSAAMTGSTNLDEHAFLPRLRELARV
jgi:hypothetical protein